MRRDELFENIKSLLSLTLIIVIFIGVIPHILLGNGIDNFLKENFSEKTTDYKSKNVIQISGSDKAKVYRTKSKKVEEMPVEEYIMGVLWSEMPVDFNEEALKAQAIAARTYYYSKRAEKCNEGNGAEICDSVHCQAYIDKNARLENWDEKARDKNYKKIKEVIDDTKGMVLTYNGELALYPQYFSTSSGKTENAEDVFSSKVPYLESVDSPGEEVSPKFESEKKLKNKEFVEIFKKEYKDTDIKEKNLKKYIEIKSRTDGGSVKSIKIGNKTIEGTKFRKLFDLKSANFELEFSKDAVTIKTKGYGHGVGMSQWGANVMGKAGKTFDYILKHYYKGTEISKIFYK
ncbi:stage II sporulation protein D [Clostridium chrysemydis]|uniref:stage II sporulation protein D n=1 Tax=Clostridium chrysemydis TaxID=2665504 RepID=UPI00188359B4|nr:stage II sporulation protein D [Clostridium chrysemydis]